MGLDQSVHAIPKRRIKKKGKFFHPYEVCKNHDELEELMSWRNHWNLCVWMNRLYYRKGGKLGLHEGYCVSFRLNERDLDAFERAIQEKELYGYKLRDSRDDRPAGSPDDEFDRYCLINDQEFLKKARQAIKDGKAVVYHDWW